MFRGKRVVVFAVLAFTIFYLFTRPAQAADAVDGVFNGVLAGANQLAVFFTHVLA